jgi:O-antigen/teichoic acid export membrane protein
LGLALLAREVLAILAPRYAEAAGVIPYIVASYLFFGGVYMTNIALDVKAKSKYMIPIMVSAVALNMALNYLLIPGFGMQGAAWSTLISYLYLFAVQLQVNQRVWRIPYEYGRLLKIVVVWLVILGSGQFMNTGRPAIDILFKLVLLANYPLLLYALRFFSSSEIDAGRRLFKSALSRLPFAHASRPSHS